MGPTWDTIGFDPQVEQEEGMVLFFFFFGGAPSTTMMFLLVVRPKTPFNKSQKEPGRDGPL